MAALAAESARSGLLAILRAVLAPAPERAGFALRLALICALTTLAAEIYSIPEPALMAYVVFFLNRPDRTSSILVNIGAMLAIPLAIGLVLLIATPVMEHAGLRLAAMATISLAILFISSAIGLQAAGGMLAMILVIATDLLGSIPFGEVANRGLVYAWLFVLIPAGVSLLVSLLIAPAPRRLAERALAHRLRITADRLDGPNETSRAAFVSGLHDGAADILARIRLARLERTSPARDLDALTQAAWSTGAVMVLADALAGDPELDIAWREEAAATLREMARAFEDGGYPVGIVLGSRPDRPLTEAFAETLASFAQPASALSATSEKIGGGRISLAAFRDPVHLHHALKTTAAAAICYLFYSLLDWPEIHTALLTCYIVSLGTAAETVEKLSLRIAGCLVGAAAGVSMILLVMPMLQSIEALLMVVFLGALLSAWVAAGSPRIAYAGFQMAFAFFLCVIQGSGPAFDLAVARDRVIGILIGNLVVYMIFTNLWPLSVSRRIDKALAELLRRLGAMARMTAPQLRQRALPTIQAETRAVRDDLQLACYEPARLRPTQDWLDRRHRLTRILTDIEGPLALGGGDPTGADRLERLANWIGAREMQGDLASAHREPPEAPEGSALGRRVAAGLDELEKILA